MKTQVVKQSRCAGLPPLLVVPEHVTRVHADALQVLKGHQETGFRVITGLFWSDVDPVLAHVHSFEQPKMQQKGSQVVRRVYVYGKPWGMIEPGQT